MTWPDGYFHLYALLHLIDNNMKLLYFPDIRFTAIQYFTKIDHMSFVIFLIFLLWFYFCCFLLYWRLKFEEVLHCNSAHLLRFPNRYSDRVDFSCILRLQFGFQIKVKNQTVRLWFRSAPVRTLGCLNVIPVTQNRSIASPITSVYIRKFK